MADALQPEIRSERLVLRPWRPSDAEQLFALFSDWEVVRWLSLPPWPYTLNDARTYIGGAIHRSSEEAEESYAITSNAEVIGSIGVRQRGVAARGWRCVPRRSARVCRYRAALRMTRPQQAR